MIEFYKYHGAGNDFILIDDRKAVFPKENINLVATICHRRFGIGADGLMLLRNHPDYDFEMVYFNSDGKESTMCGNGGRCIVAFAHKLGIAGHSTRFLAVDGPHNAEIIKPDHIRLQMTDVTTIERGEDYFFLDTGSPHYVRVSNDVDGIDIIPEAHAIRYNERFKTKGTNVNFMEIQPDGLKVRTYERGVEDETYACGTGVVASAICAGEISNHAKTSFPVEVKGGQLHVSYDTNKKGKFHNIWLEGPAVFVFKGEYTE
ncbi:MAG: diaminopimelate epimerase [Bacteroidota bacterium]